MGIARSTFYDKPAAQDDTAIVEAIAAICEEFEFYGWRRVRAELRHRGMIVNHKKVRRLMREHDLQPRRRRRYVATTDSDHDQPIYPNRTKDVMIDGPNQLWVADITYVAIREGFAYVAVILDAWSRKAVGYALSRSIDVRLTLAALTAAIERRKPPPGCVHHTDRGSQYAAQDYRVALLRHGLVGSMGRRGNPYDNPKAESFMKTLKVEAVYPMASSLTSTTIFRGSSTRSTTLVVSTQRWAISARNSLSWTPDLGP
jgi:putative transposase